MFLICSCSHFVDAVVGGGGSFVTSLLVLEEDWRGKELISFACNLDSSCILIE